MLALTVSRRSKGLVVNVGLMPPATLAQRLGLPELLRRHVRLGKVEVRPTPDCKAMTMIWSAGMSEVLG